MYGSWYTVQSCVVYTSYQYGLSQVCTDSVHTCRHLLKFNFKNLSKMNVWIVNDAFYKHIDKTIGLNWFGKSLYFLNSFNFHILKACVLFLFYHCNFTDWTDIIDLHQTVLLFWSARGYYIFTYCFIMSSNFWASSGWYKVNEINLQSCMVYTVHINISVHYYDTVRLFPNIKAIHSAGGHCLWPWASIREGDWEAHPPTFW